MSRNSNRSNSSGNEFPIFAGIMLGIVMGLAIAGGIAWFIIKKNTVPAPAVKETPQATLSASPDKTILDNAAAPNTHGGTSNGKARFEFYKELTDKPNSALNRKADKADASITTPVTAVKPAQKTGTYFLQEGAYTNMDDAEKIKAKLALLGMVASIQPTNIPDKGLWYRVRLGPYQNTTEVNDALATLKLNGLSAATIKIK